MSSGEDDQYANPSRLSRRGSLHDRYAEIGWFGWLADRLSLEPNADVLDVGCGPAWFWKSAAARMPTTIRLTLTDLSAGMVDAADDRFATGHPFASLDTLVADAGSLPFDDDSFDAVVAMHMVYHLPDPRAGLAEWHRVLRPGGRLFLTANGAGNLGSMHELLHVFGPEGAGPVTSLLSLDDVEPMVRETFADVVREDLVQTYRIDDPEMVVAYLRSFPPGDGASADEVAALRETVHDAFEGGVLETECRMGLIAARAA